MDPQIIEIEPISVNAQRKSRIIGVTVQAAFWVLCMFVWKYLTLGHSADTGDLAGLMLSCSFGGIIYALLMYFLPLQRIFRTKRNPPVRAGIRIECDQVARLYQTSESASWITQTAVRRGMVRSIFKIPGGIGVSERGQFGARMLGFLVIPNTLPKFDEVRSLLNSWQVKEAGTDPNR